MCLDSRNPALPLQNTLALLNSLNACLPRIDRFDAQVGSCTMELLTSLLGQLPLVPGHLVAHQERGQCGNCGGLWLQVGPY